MVENHVLKATHNYLLSIRHLIQENIRNTQFRFVFLNFPFVCQNISIVRTLKEDQLLRLLLNLLFYHFNLSEPTYKSQCIKLLDVIASCNQSNVNAHVSLETECNAVRVINSTTLRG